MSPAPLRKPPEPDQPDELLVVCSVCRRSWREADDCTTPKDCNWIREKRE